MAGNVLSAQITADGSKFTKTLAELGSQLKRFQDALKTTNSVESFNRLTRAIDATKSRIGAIGNVQDPFKKVTQSSGAATQSLINVGRVAQDLPFGFIGIANNLNPLLESFQRLKAESGSTSTALKSLVGGLAGPAGIGVALSVVSSLLISFGGALFGSKDASMASADALKEFSDAADDAKKSIEGLTSALQFANELGGINIKIRGQSDLANLKEQSIAQQQFVVDLTAQKDKLKVIGEQIVKNTELSAEDQAKAIENNAKDVEDAGNKVVDAERKRDLLFRQIALQRVEDAKDAAKKAKEARDKEVADTISKAKELASFFQDRSIRDIQFADDPFENLQQTFKRAKDFIKKVDLKGEVINARDFKLPIGFDFNVVDLGKTEEKFDKAFQKVLDQYPDLQEKLGKEIETLTKRNPILIKGIQIQLDIEAAKKKLLQQSQDLVNSIQGAVEGAIVGLAETLGEALSGKDIGKQLFSVIGDLIEQIGKALIKFGLVKSGLDAILANPLALPGGAAIALGIAAVAIGSLVKNIKVSGQRAMGGPVVGGNAYLVGERGPEIFRPNNSGTIIPNNRISGSRPNAGGTQLYGTVKVSGADLILAISNASKSQRRLN
jgi:predicted PurR-regulated permease PerM